MKEKLPASPKLLTVFILVTVFLGTHSFRINKQKVSLPEGFVYLQEIIPNITIMPRYASNQNFVGEVIDGYLRPTIIISLQAALAIKSVEKNLNGLGYTLVVYDAYRPQKAVTRFFQFFQEPQNYKTKALYYPYISKEEIYDKGYVAKKSGHTRGSTIDLTMMKITNKVHQPIFYNYTLTNGKQITIIDDGTEFMCGNFDLCDESSHQNSPLISQKCLESRQILKKVMKNSGFKELEEEWWHFTLKDEPFPDTYFDFDVL